MSTAEPVSVTVKPCGFPYCDCSMGAAERCERLAAFSHHVPTEPASDLEHKIFEILTHSYPAPFAKVDALAKQIASLSHVQAPADSGLIKFAKEMLDCAWQGGSMDGGTIQEVAEECGLIRCTKFDPNKHTDHYGDFEEGQDWYVYAGPLTSPAPQIDEAMVERAKLANALQAMLDTYGPPVTVSDECQYPEWHAITLARKALQAAIGDAKP